MTQVHLTYNPYTKERQLQIGSQEIVGDQLSNFCGAKGSELSQWCGALWEKLGMHKADDITLHFTGIQRDYDFLEDAKKKADNAEFSYVLKAQKITKVEDKLNGLETTISKDAGGDTL